MVASTSTFPTDPDREGRESILSDSDALRLLSRKVRLGMVLSWVWFWSALVSSILAFHQFRSGPWSVALLVVALAGSFVHYRTRQKISIVRRASKDPSVVFWAHRTVLRRKSGDRIIDVPFVTLHLRDGSTYEVAMSQLEMDQIAVWLRSRNPSVKIGSYD